MNTLTPSPSAHTNVFQSLLIEFERSILFSSRFVVLSHFFRVVNSFQFWEEKMQQINIHWVAQLQCVQGILKVESAQLAGHLRLDFNLHQRIEYSLNALHAIPGLRSYFELIHLSNLHFPNHALLPFSLREFRLEIWTLDTLLHWTHYCFWINCWFTTDYRICNSSFTEV